MRVLKNIRGFSKRFARDDSGMALMMVAVVSVIIFILLTGTLTMLEHRDRQITGHTTRNKAMQLADAGINEYMFQLSEDYRFYQHTPELESTPAPGAGVSGWKVTASPPHEGNLLMLTSTGMLADGTSRTVTATVKFPNFVDYCVFVIKDYSVGEGFTFDGKVYVTGWLTMDTRSEVTGLAQSYTGFKTSNPSKTMTLTDNRLAPGTKPYTGGARKLSNPLTMDSVTNDLAEMKTASQDGGIYLPAYNPTKFGSIPPSRWEVVDTEAFTSTWPSGWTRSNTTYVTTTNQTGRASSGYAAQVTSGNSRQTNSFYRDYDLRGYAQARLSFWNRTSFSGGSDYARVEYSTNGGTTWTQIYNQTTQKSGATTSNLSIPIPTDGVVRLRFTGSVNTSSEYVSFDDIEVEGWTGVYTSRQGYRLTFNNAQVTVEAVMWESQTDGTLGISATAPLASGKTVPIPANGIIYVEGPCWVQGTYSQKVTVAVPAPYDIIVPDHLKYASTSPKATCGLVAGGDIAFPHWYESMPDDLYVYAAMMSQQGFVNIDNPPEPGSQKYFPKNWQYASSYASNRKNSINLIGSRAMDNMGSGLQQGFVGRNSEPDPRLYDDPPPMYPNVQGEDLEIMTWHER
ncbi:MAG: hypothetical protein RBS78_05940 [Coriobacteriia bacterium]|jgi:hypothetical protein|nr:hypothetical protein [Coriobacteriia bacterium]